MWKLTLSYKFVKIISKKITRKKLDFEKMSSFFLLLIGWSGLLSLLLLFGKNFG
jgi:hypothetical protein